MASSSASHQSFTDCTHCRCLCLGPTILPCGHIICRKCLRQILDGLDPTCPSCGHGIPRDEGQTISEVIDQLSKDLILEELVWEQLSMRGDFKCMACPSKLASVVCLDCGDLFCDDCSWNHSEGRPLRDLHVLQGLPENVDTSRTTTPATSRHGSLNQRRAQRDLKETLRTETGLLKAKVSQVKKAARAVNDVIADLQEVKEGLHQKEELLTTYTIGLATVPDARAIFPRLERVRADCAPPPSTVLKELKRKAKTLASDRYAGHKDQTWPSIILSGQSRFEAARRTSEWSALSHATAQMDFSSEESGASDSEELFAPDMAELSEVPFPQHQVEIVIRRDSSGHKEDETDSATKDTPARIVRTERLVAVPHSTTINMPDVGLVGVQEILDTAIQHAVENVLIAKIDWGDDVGSFQTTDDEIKSPRAAPVPDLPKEEVHKDTAQPETNSKAKHSMTLNEDSQRDTTQQEKHSKAEQDRMHHGDSANEALAQENGSSEKQDLLPNGTLSNETLSQEKHCKTEQGQQCNEDSTRKILAPQEIAYKKEQDLLTDGDVSQGEALQQKTVTESLKRGELEVTEEDKESDATEQDREGKKNAESQGETNEGADVFQTMPADETHTETPEPPEGRGTEVKDRGQTAEVKDNDQTVELKDKGETSVLPNGRTDVSPFPLTSEAKVISKADETDSGINTGQDRQTEVETEGLTAREKKKPVHGEAAAEDTELIDELTDKTEVAKLPENYAGEEEKKAKQEERKSGGEKAKDRAHTEPNGGLFREQTDKDETSEDNEKDRASAGQDGRSVEEKDEDEIGVELDHDMYRVNIRLRSVHAELKEVVQKKAEDRADMATQTETENGETTQESQQLRETTTEGGESNQFSPAVSSTREDMEKSKLEKEEREDEMEDKKDEKSEQQEEAEKVEEEADKETSEQTLNKGKEEGGTLLENKEDETRTQTLNPFSSIPPSAQLNGRRFGGKRVEKEERGETAEREAGSVEQAETQQMETAEREAGSVEEAETQQMETAAGQQHSRADQEEAFRQTGNNDQQSGKQRGETPAQPSQEPREEFSKDYDEIKPEQALARDSQPDPDPHKAREKVVHFILRPESRKTQLVAELVKQMKEGGLPRVVERLFEEFHVRLLGVDSGLNFLMETTMAQWGAVVARQRELQGVVGELFPGGAVGSWAHVAKCGAGAESSHARLGQPVPLQFLPPNGPHVRKDATSLVHGQQGAKGDKWRPADHGPVAESTPRPMKRTLLTESSAEHTSLVGASVPGRAGQQTPAAVRTQSGQERGTTSMKESSTERAALMGASLSEGTGEGKRVADMTGSNPQRRLSAEEGCTIENTQESGNLTRERSKSQATHDSRDVLETDCATQAVQESRDIEVKTPAVQATQESGGAGETGSPIQATRGQVDSLDEAQSEQRDQMDAAESEQIRPEDSVRAEPVIPVDGPKFGLARPENEDVLEREQAGLLDSDRAQQANPPDTAGTEQAGVPEAGKHFHPLESSVREPVRGPDAKGSAAEDRVQRNADDSRTLDSLQQNGNCDADSPSVTDEARGSEGNGQKSQTEDGAAPVSSPLAQRLSVNSQKDAGQEEKNVQQPQPQQRQHHEQSGTRTDDPDGDAQGETRAADGEEAVPQGVDDTTCPKHHNMKPQNDDGESKSQYEQDVVRPHPDSGQAQNDEDPEPHDEQEAEAHKEEANSRNDGDELFRASERDNKEIEEEASKSDEKFPQLNITEVETDLQRREPESSVSGAKAVMKDTATAQSQNGKGQQEENSPQQEPVEDISRSSSSPAFESADSNAGEEEEDQTTAREGTRNLDTQAGNAGGEQSEETYTEAASVPRKRTRHADTETVIVSERGIILTEEETPQQGTMRAECVYKAEERTSNGNTEQRQEEEEKEEIEEEEEAEKEEFEKEEDVFERSSDSPEGAGEQSPVESAEPRRRRSVPIAEATPDPRKLSHNDDSQASDSDTSSVGTTEYNLEEYYMRESASDLHYDSDGDLSGQNSFKTHQNYPISSSLSSSLIRDDDKDDGNRRKLRGDSEGAKTESQFRIAQADDTGTTLKDVDRDVESGLQFRDVNSQDVKNGTDLRDVSRHLGKEHHGPEIHHKKSIDGRAENENGDPSHLQRDSGSGMSSQVPDCHTQREADVSTFPNQQVSRSAEPSTKRQKMEDAAQRTVTQKQNGHTPDVGTTESGQSYTAWHKEIIPRENAARNVPHSPGVSSAADEQEESLKKPPYTYSRLVIPAVFNQQANNQQAPGARPFRTGAAAGSENVLGFSRKPGSPQTPGNQTVSGQHLPTHPRSYRQRAPSPERLSPPQHSHEGSGPPQPAPEKRYPPPIPEKPPRRAEPSPKMSPPPKPSSAGSRPLQPKLEGSQLPQASPEKARAVQPSPKTSRAPPPPNVSSASRPSAYAPNSNSFGSVLASGMASATPEAKTRPKPTNEVPPETRNSLKAVSATSNSSKLSETAQDAKTRMASATPEARNSPKLLRRDASARHSGHKVEPVPHERHSPTEFNLKGVIQARKERLSMQHSRSSKEAAPFNPMTSSPKRKFLKRPDAEGDSHKEGPGIVAVVALRDGRYAMTDFRNKSVKISDPNSRGRFYVLKLDDKPLTLATLRNDTVAVTSLSKYIYRIDVSSSPCVLSKVQTERKYWGVGSASVDDTLVVSCCQDKDGPASIDILSRSGAVIKTVVDSSTLTELNVPNYLCVLNGEVLVSDCQANAVFRVDLATGWVVERLKHPDLVMPHQVTSDLSGHVYVASNKRKCLLVMSPGGQWRRLLSGSEHGDESRVYPVGVCVNSSGLVVTWNEEGGYSVVAGYDLK